MAALTRKEKRGPKTHSDNGGARADAAAALATHWRRVVGVEEVTDRITRPATQIPRARYKGGGQQHRRGTNGARPAVLWLVSSTARAGAHHAPERRRPEERRWVGCRLKCHRREGGCATWGIHSHTRKHRRREHKEDGAERPDEEGRKHPGMHACVVVVAGLLGCCCYVDARSQRRWCTRAVVVVVAEGKKENDGGGSREDKKTP